VKFVSLFAGVGGFDLGLERSGHTCIGQVEIDKNARAVLDEHWPNVPKHDDVTTAIDWADEIGLTGTVDLVAGGFPCQDVSVAGRRAGLAGERSGLFFDALAFATHVKAKTIILENVPGLLTSNQGRDFGTVLTELADAGYSNVEWRVFDSQWFGVPQRRRRIFIVASSGNASFKQILTEREGSTRDSSSSHQQKQDTSGIPKQSLRVGSIIGSDIVGALCATDFKFPQQQQVHENKIVIQDEVYGQSGYGDYDLGVKTLNASMHKRPEDSIVVFSPRYDEAARIHDSEIAPTVATYYGTGGSNMPFVARSKRVRRLTPTECERLQGFPDGWTESQADTHRYKQMGNAVTVNVIKWIGDRL
jgi:DNA (cytosine-5)-methyltransferase 1